MSGPKSFRTVLRRFRQVFAKPEPQDKKQAPETLNPYIQARLESIKQRAKCLNN